MDEPTLLLHAELVGRTTRQPLDRQKSSEIHDQISRVLSEEKLYLNPELTLDDLASSIGIVPRVVSQVINENICINNLRFRSFRKIS